MSNLDRITFTPGVVGGRARIRGLRFPVSTILNSLKVGRTVEELLADFPYLEREDIEQAIEYGGKPRLRRRIRRRELENTAPEITRQWIPSR